MVKGDNGNGNIYDDSHVDDKIVMMMTKLTPYTKKPIVGCQILIIIQMTGITNHLMFG